MKLYDFCGEWKEPIYVISDPHFDDFDCKMMNPKWISPEEQVKKINSKVGKNGTIVILGDVGNIEWVKKLKGYKVLITGNHDKGASNYLKEIKLEVFACEDQAKEFTKSLDPKWSFKRCNPLFNRGETVYFVEYNNGLFDEVYDGPLFAGPNLLLSHEPIDIPFGINIHGHRHNHPFITRQDENSYSVNVAADVVNFEPQRLKKLCSIQAVKDIHRLTIDRHIDTK